MLINEDSINSEDSINDIEIQGQIYQPLSGQLPEQRQRNSLLPCTFISYSAASYMVFLMYHNEISSQYAIVPLLWLCFGLSCHLVGVHEETENLNSYQR